MLQSRVLLIENANDLLVSFTALVRRMEQKDPLFIPALFDWIAKAEALLVQYKLPHSASLAGLKAKLLMPDYDSKVRAQRKKQQVRLACEYVYDIQHSVQDAVALHRDKVEAAQDILMQLFSILAQTSSENGNSLHVRPKESLTAFASRLWHLICHHEQLKASAVKLRSLLSDSDIQILIARDIDLTLFTQTEHA